MNQSDDVLKINKNRKISIRQMELDDLAPVFHLGEALFTARKVPNLYRTWDEYELIELFHAHSELCLVAESDGKILGFALGTVIEKDHSAWKYGYLVWFGVDAQSQRTGVGVRLFQHLRDRLVKQKVRMLMVDTEANNLDALHFFRKLGFGKPEEHIYLSLNLAAQKRDKTLKGTTRPGENGR